MKAFVLTILPNGQKIREILTTLLWDTGIVIAEQQQIDVQLYWLFVGT